MKVKPNELANLCAIYSVAGVTNISSENLNKYLNQCKLIDSYSNANSIIDESKKCGLTYFKFGKYFLTRTGRQLGKHQGKPTVKLSGKAKDYFAKNILLNISLEDWCCGDLLLKFNVDTVLKTLVFNRSRNDSLQDTRRLMMLENVGLIEVNSEVARLNPEFLGIINDFFLKLRDPIHKNNNKVTEEQTDIGDLAEKLALIYEKHRLIKNGHNDLSLLVEHTSTVLQSAGYDIKSFRGTGDNPETRIYIEVKGTKYNSVQFFWSRNERSIAEKARGHYWLYCYSNVDLDNKKADGPFRIRNPSHSLERLGYLIKPLDVFVIKSEI